MRQIKNIMSNNIYVIKMVFKDIPFFACLKLFISIIVAFLDVVMYTYSFKYIIDGLQMNKEIWKLFSFIIILMTIVLFVHFINSFIFNLLEPIAFEKLSKSMQRAIYYKAGSVDIECYDNPNFHQEYILASGNSVQKVKEVYNNFVGLVSQSISIGSLVFILTSTDVFGLIFAITSVIAGSFTNVLLNKCAYEREVSLIPLYRKRDYTGKVFYIPEYAKEIRTLNIKKILKQKFNESIDDIIAENKKYAKKLISIRIANYMLTGFLTNVIYIAILVYQVTVLESITLGDFMALYLCMDKLGFFVQIIMETLSKFHESSLWIVKYRSFLQYKNKVEDKGTFFLSDNKINFKLDRVFFKYPEQSYNILNDINFEVEKGKKLLL